MPRELCARLRNDTAAHLCSDPLSVYICYYS
jgi:hypothetical protein